MDELEILKKDWKKREHSFNQLTEKDIYKMLHKRSSSIVKWILIISILEIVLWLTLSFFTTDEHYFKTLEIYHLNKIIPVITIINYGIIIFFIFQFYKNFKNMQKFTLFWQCRRLQHCQKRSKFLPIFLDNFSLNHVLCFSYFFL